MIWTAQTTIPTLQIYSGCKTTQLLPDLPPDLDQMPQYDSIMVHEQFHM